MTDTNFNVQKLRKIGSGGFGSVFEAKIHTLSETVAIKELLLAGNSQEAIDRFKREVKIQSKLDHPNILPVVFPALDENPPWYAMPLASCSLLDVIDDLRFNDYDDKRFIHIFYQVFEGIRYAHEKSVIHRDLKPHNILLFDDDKVKIADFGLGKDIDSKSLTVTITDTNRAMLGSFFYSAPEQLENLKKADYRSDIYSLGAVMYHVLTGYTHIHFQYQLLPGKFQYVVKKCTSLNPNDRYQSIEDLLEDFSVAVGDSIRISQYNTVESEVNSILTSAYPILRLERLAEIFSLYFADEDLYFAYFPKIRGKLLQSYIAKYFNSFSNNLKYYDSHVKGSLPFHYCDTVGDFYTEIYDLINDLEIKELILRRLVVLSCSHNRWYVMDIVSEIIARKEDTSSQLLIRQVLRDHPYETITLSTRILNQDPPDIIAAEIRNIKAMYELFS